MVYKPKSTSSDAKIPPSLSDARKAPAPDETEAEGRSCLPIPASHSATCTTSISCASFPAYRRPERRFGERNWITFATP
jgi:hypothetical protein